MVHAPERQKLLSRLLEAVKQCQIRFGGKTELATERDSSVNVLCHCWEAVLQHGMKHNNKAISTLKQFTTVTGLTKVIDDINYLETEPAFWCYVKMHLSIHEVKRCMVLKNVQTDSGRGMAWLRSALNEHSLEKYMHTLISSKEQLSLFYEEWAFLRDEEKSQVLPNLAAGVASILFAINIDNPDFNVIRPATGLSSFLSKVPPPQKPVTPEVADPVPVVIGKTIVEDVTKERRRKKKPAKIVTFDDEETSSLSGSPSSSVISPAVISNHISGTAQHTVPVFDIQQQQSRFYGDISTSLRNDSLSNNVPSSTTAQSTFYSNSKSGHLPGEAQNSSSLCSNGFISNNSSPDSIEFSRAKASPKTFDDKFDVYGSNASRSPESIDVGMSLNERVAALNAEIDIAATTSPHCTTFSNVANSSGSVAAVDIPVQTKEKASHDLVHSSSYASNISAASSSSPAERLFSSEEVDSSVSLVPLTSSGRPVEFDLFRSTLDGDTASYGSYDSRDSMHVYEEAMHRATSAVYDMHQTLTRQPSNRAGADNVVDVKESSYSLTNEEMRDALVAMMLRKEEVEEQARRIQLALDAEVEISATLRSELKEMKDTSERSLEKEVEKNKNLARENELLKHQLKKYVSAVQMLRRQGASAEDFPGIHLEPLQPAIPSPSTSADYSYEAEEYEKKLIQVAEMHGELMEFNELLQRQLLVRDSHIKHLTSELVTLRGPLPESHTVREDVLDYAWDSDTSSLTAHPLINIWIPSAFLRESTGSAYHVYQVYVRIRDDEWNVYRRYSEFYELHCKMKKQHAVVNTYNFPPKKSFGKNDLRIVEIRRKRLQTYLRNIIMLLTQNVADLTDSPTKQKLVKAVQFFSDQPLVDNSKRNRGHHSRSRTDSELTRVDGQSSSTGTSQQQTQQLYNGL